MNNKLITHIFCLFFNAQIVCASNQDKLTSPDQEKTEQAQTVLQQQPDKQPGLGATITRPVSWMEWGLLGTATVTGIGLAVLDSAATSDCAPAGTLSLSSRPSAADPKIGYGTSRHVFADWFKRGKIVRNACLAGFAAIRVAPALAAAVAPYVPAIAAAFR